MHQYLNTINDWLYWKRQSTLLFKFGPRKTKVLKVVNGLSSIQIYSINVKLYIFLSLSNWPLTIWRKNNYLRPADSLSRDPFATIPRENTPVGCLGVFRHCLNPEGRRSSLDFLQKWVDATRLHAWALKLRRQALAIKRYASSRRKHIYTHSKETFSSKGEGNNVVDLGTCPLFHYRFFESFILHPRKITPLMSPPQLNVACTVGIYRLWQTSTTPTRKCAAGRHPFCRAVIALPCSSWSNLFKMNDTKLWHRGHY